ncbi:MAG: hypothetical protein ACXWZM_07480 [Solirubrobacterales bacterium]
MALARIGNEYLIFGAAALISLVAFVTLILVPALSSYGRVWEKIAAGFLSLFVLVVLVSIGVGLGVLIVVNYNEITDLFSQG